MTNIYYNWLFEGIKPKKKKYLLYCYIRKLLTIKENPSSVLAWCMNNENKM